MIPWGRRVCIVVGDDLEPFDAPQLPCEFAPESSYVDAVRPLVHAARRDCGPHQYGAPNARKFTEPGCLKNGLDAWEICGCHTREQVIQSEERVCLATTEIGLKGHGRISSDGGETLDGELQQI